MVRCGKSLVEPRFLNSIEGYLVVDQFEYLHQNEVAVKVFLRNYGISRRVTIEVESCGNIVDRRNVTIPSGERYDIELYTKLSEGCTVKLLVDGKALDVQEFKPVRTTDIENTLYLLLVFHHHQPPNYGPDMVYRTLWPFVYVWDPVLFPYGLGPYHYQAVLLKSMGTGVKCVYNLSPSLIKQWKDIVEHGIETLFEEFEFVEPSSELARIVRETMDLYRELAASGIIDVLTSIYAHTIAGYIVDKFGLEDLIYRELEYGYSITKEFTGTSPRGVWLPEMSFSMKLIHIMSSLNLEYTFLDERYHLREAQGDVSNHFEPYTVQDPVTGEEIVVFFRDTELSNDIGFNTNFCSDIHAIKGAYAFVAKIVEKAVVDKAKVLTLALDGENWMSFSRNPPASAQFLRTFLEILKRLGKTGTIVLAHPVEVLSKVPPSRKIKFIPSTTWLGSYRKWRGEVEEHEKFWQIVEHRVEMYKRYVMDSGFDERAKKAEWALWHILDSDYWWAEFWNKEFITMWINEFDKYIPPR